MRVDTFNEWADRAASRLGLNVKRAVRTGRGSSHGSLTAGGDLRKIGQAREIRQYERKLRKGFGPTGQAQLRELGDILAWMDSRNIYQDEFPNFDKSLIPQYRETAKNMLVGMGPAAAKMLLDDLMMRDRSQGGMPRSRSYIPDVLDVLNRIGRLPPGEGASPETIRHLLKRVGDSPKSDEKKAEWYRILLRCLPSDALLSLPMEPSDIADAWGRELTERFAGSGGAGQPRIAGIVHLIKTAPERYLQIRRELPGLSTTFDRALERVTARELKKAYEETGSWAALSLLLEKPDGLEVMTVRELKNPTIRDKMLQAAESGVASPGLCATLIQGRKLSVEQSRELVCSGKPWERVGAYRLLLKRPGKSERDIAWLLSHLEQLPPSGRSMLGTYAARLVPRAGTDALVAAMSIDHPDVRREVLAALTARRDSPAVKAEMRKQQQKLIDAFAADRAASRDLIPLLAGLRTNAALAALIDGLTDADQAVWKACRNELCVIHADGIRFGPANDADLSARAAAKAKWQTWLKHHAEQP